MKLKFFFLELIYQMLDAIQDLLVKIEHFEADTEVEDAF